MLEVFIMKKDKKELKNQTIIFRVTESKKNEMVEKARNAGLSMTEYIEACSNSAVIVSLTETKKILKELHQLNFHISKSENYAEIKDYYSGKIIQVKNDIKYVQNGCD